MSSTSTTGLFGEYEAICDRYRAEYGSDGLVVLIEVGSFYEIYGCGPGRGCDVQRICGLLNIQPTRRNKNNAEVSPTNPELGGFPSVALPKYLPVLIDAGLTVVIADQDPLHEGKEVQRKVSRVVSRSTYSAGLELSSDSSQCRRDGLAVIFLETSPGSRVQLLGCGVACIDLCTGQSSCWEEWIAQGSSTTAATLSGSFPRACALLAATRVSEVVLAGGSREFSLTAEDILRIVPSLEDARSVHDWRHSRDSSRDSSGDSSRRHYAVREYQDAVIRKVFASEDMGFLSPAEFLSLEKQTLALAAFVAMIDFVHRHDEVLAVNLPRPRVVDSSCNGKVHSFLSLSPSALRDLDIVESNQGKSKSLLGLLNRCVTAGGRRLFAQRLLEPATCPAEIQKRHAAVQLFLDRDLAAPARNILRGCCDVQRCWRRITLISTSAARISAHLRDVVLVRDAALRVRQLCRDLIGISGNLDESIAGIDADIDNILDHARAVDPESSILDGAYEDLDAARAELRALEQDERAWIDAIRAKASNKWNQDWIRVTLSSSGSVEATCTARRFDALVEAGIVNPSEVTVLSSKVRSSVKSEAVRFVKNVDALRQGQNVDALRQGQSVDALRVRSRHDEVLQARTRSIVAELAANCQSSAMRISNAVALVDVYAAAALDAKENRLVRPQILLDLDSSQFQCRALRHPIAERQLSQRVVYVPNDVSLGSSESRLELGMLLYGVNAAGKSTLSKATALAVIMAQAGLFVACDSMELVPFREIFTRMPARDDIFQGKSTFMMEMAELRDIMARAGPGSLVVGDELCSGTESVSAVSLVGAACLTLVRRHVKFVFATHLHELPGLPAIASEKRIGVAHLNVRYDSSIGALVYERLLKDGPGRALYGLEVARAMDLDPEFLELSHEIRRELMGIPDSIVSTRRSHYNRRVYVDVCGMCGKRMAEEVHHVVPQSAYASGPVNAQSARVDMNSAANLVPLCSACHDAVHRSTTTPLNAPGLPLQTTRGILRV
jgi:DNA mismatch repair protein MutS